MLDLLHSTGRVGDGMKCSPRQIHDLTVDPIEATRPDLVFSELIFEKLDCRTIRTRVCHVSCYYVQSGQQWRVRLVSEIISVFCTLLKLVQAKKYLEKHNPQAKQV